LYRGSERTPAASYPCPTPEEVRLILAHAKPELVETGRRANNGSEKGRPVYRGINQNDYTDLYRAICLTEMRRDEARFLMWEDVDLTSKIILIRPGHKNGRYWQPKSKASIRRIPIVPELKDVLDRLRRSNRHNRWVFETRRGTQLSENNPTDRLGEICEMLGFKERYVLHSLRKYWASTMAQQGIPPMVLTKMFGHTDVKLIMKVYYKQNDDALMVEQASKIDFRLEVPKVG
jgi:integrase